MIKIEVPERGCCCLVVCQFVVGRRPSGTVGTGDIVFNVKSFRIIFDAVNEKHQIT